MAALDDLIQQIKDPELRDRIQKEADSLLKQKKFGLVFEDHLPECTPLYGMPIKRKSQVAMKTGEVNDIYIVDKIVGDQAECVHSINHETVTLPVKDLVVVAKFGDPIFPCLKAMDSVCNAPDSDLWHTLIEADNYHALQLLKYLYAGKVDCIYIDPPYNSGAKDWKYNNDYVDVNDSYRHSKWLSMMEKRLSLAKTLLTPYNSVLIITIDEKEYLHLGCLLEEMFKDSRIQMVDCLINPKGVSRGGFRRADEYIFFVMQGDAVPARVNLGEEWSPSANKATNKKNGSLRSSRIEPDWTSMMRRGSHSSRVERPGLYYPIYVDPNKKEIVKIGESLPLTVDRGPDFDGLVQVLPLRTNGSLGCWQVGPKELENRKKQGRIRLGKPTSYGYVVNYLPDGVYSEIIRGDFQIDGYASDGSLIAHKTVSEQEEERIAPTQWKIASHNASEHGSTLLGNMLVNRKFPFPKSIYAVQDAIRFFVLNKSTALIVDFFSGSGTTLNAVNLLNAEDGGSRRCIMVTNNEVSAEEASSLSAKGFQPGDEEWEKLGIARYINWPRTKCSILGVDVNGNPISGEYLTTCKQTIETDRKIIQIAMDGNSMSTDAKKSIISLLEKSKIPQNALTKNSNYILGEDYTTSILFNLEYMDEWLDALEEQTQVAEIYIVTDKKPVFNQIKSRIKETLGTISKEEPVKFPMSDGFKANAAFFKLGFLDKNAVALGHQFKEILSTLWMKAGAIGPCPVIEDTPDDMLILPKNRFAVLLEETMFNEFADKMQASPDIQTIYFITDSEKSFRDMSNQFASTTTYQLYRDYLDNFRINIGR